MVPERPLDATEHGLVPKGEGWFVLNARDARWSPADGRGAYSDLEGEPEFEQLGIHLVTLGPGEPMAMYHWEADQEDFLLLAGEALLIVEGEERPLRAWDFVHCPAGTKHVIVGAGDRAVPPRRGRRPRQVDGPGLGRLHRRRGGPAPRRGRRDARRRRPPRRTRASPHVGRPGTARAGCPTGRRLRRYASATGSYRNSVTPESKVFASSIRSLVGSPSKGRVPCPHSTGCSQNLSSSTRPPARR